MKRIGMIVAVEINAVLNKYGTPQEELLHKGMRLMVYNADGYQLYVLNCGIGEIAAAAGTQMLISEFGVEMIVNFGVVGGLTEEMALAKTCIVEKVVHYGFDGSQGLHYPQGQYPGTDSVYFEASKELIAHAKSMYPDLKSVICASADKFVADPDEKRSIHSQFSADICEMEAAGILITSNRNGIPCLLIKTVSDSVEGGAEEFALQVERSAEICVEIADNIIKGF